MHYSNIIKCSVSLIQNQAETVSDQIFETPEVEQPVQAESEMMQLLRKLSEGQQQSMPSSIEDSNLDQYEVDLVLETVQELHEKYFQDIPLSKVLDQKFVFNIPKIVPQTINYIKQNPDIPDAMNLTMLLYLFFTDVPFDAIGRYLEIMSDLIDSSREAINDDSQAYLADAMDGDGEDE